MKLSLSKREVKMILDRLEGTRVVNEQALLDLHEKLFLFLHPKRKV